ncbi:transition state regulator Abh [Mesobacillus campisalis]|uniref:Transition state regulator Abh n=1 Tax=Mesobacillus campisalis TaxID=1408103 RepID=A0A0M2SWK4_9BACI|nr:AbrB/MazE/SpoVT family DNA-binding domain-containing protein [Mesobacillus campisalis]KKK37337.1 transition state regulator Abh [Mesobacillus campisalis]
MKATGIVRKTDQLGRIVIPMELRKKMGIQENDPLEIFVDEDTIILQKYQPDKTCMMTGNVSQDNHEFAGGKIILSREGAERLAREIEELLVK